MLWAVQDFRIRLPHTFILEGHNFGAGLTRLSFRDSGLTMHTCRLAGAEQRLQSTSMSGLINLLGELNAPEEGMKYTDSTVEYCSYPSILRQIRDRLKRRLPFQRAILRHHQEYDRISGLFFFDKKPIPETLVTNILDSYEILPL